MRAGEERVPVWALLQQTSLRHWRVEWRQTLVLLLIVATGVGSYLSIRMANRAAIASFGSFTEAVQGQSDWILVPPDGRFSLRWIDDVRDALGGRPVHLMPVLEATGALHKPGAANEAYGSAGLRVVGLDLVALGNLSSATARSTRETVEAADGSTDAELAPFLDDPTSALLAPALSKQLNLGAGDALPVILNDRIVPLEVRGTLQGNTASGQPVPPNLVLLDLNALQFWTNNPQRVHRVEVVLSEGYRNAENVNEVGQLLREASEGRWQVEGPDVASESGEEMTAAFRLNLLVLSLIALLVGIYLVGQAMDAAVVRRRREIGILRSLGLTAGTIRRLWLLEIGAFGLAGSILGVVLAALIAPFAVRAVSETVNALYGGSVARSASLTVEDLVIGVALGLGASLVSGWIPARDAARTPPAQVMRSGNVSLGLAVLRHVPLGLALLAAGALVQLMPPLELSGGARFPLAGYAAAILWLAGGTILCGGLIRVLAKLLPVQRSGAAASAYARSRLCIPTSRHRLAAAGLFVAVAMAAAMSFLIGSFEHTMVRWIDQRFRADVYIISAGVQHAGSSNAIRESTAHAIAQMEAVADVDRGFATPVEFRGLPTLLAASEFRLLGSRQALAWMEGPRPLVEQPELTQAWAAANESFARRFNVSAGDVISVSVGGEKRQIWIRGIDADYGNERGRLLLDRALLEAWLPGETVSSLSIYLKPGTPVDTFVHEIRAEHPGLRVRSNANLRATILEIFEQTFAVTRVLKWIGVGVAVVGLALALISILRESRDELWTLRSLGMTRDEIGRATALESTGIAAAGLAGGLLASVGLGYLLIYVVNRQSFGWTLQFAVPWGELGLLSALVLTIALALGFLQGRWAWNLQHTEHE